MQKYWKELLQLIKSGELHPEIVITHEPTLDKAPAAYEVFNKKLDGCIKVKSLFWCWKQLGPTPDTFCHATRLLYFMLFLCTQVVMHPTGGPCP